MRSSTRGGHEFEPAAGTIQTTRSGSPATPTVVTLTIRGRLDGAAGRSLADAARAALEPTTERLDIDLREVDGFTPMGANALLQCRDLGAALVDGVHYRTGGGAGGDALLVAYQGPSAVERAAEGAAD